MALSCPWDIRPNTHNFKEEKFILVPSFTPWLAGSQVNMAGKRPGQRKVAHIMGTRKQTEKGDAREGDAPFWVLSPVNFLFLPGPTS